MSTRRSIVCTNRVHIYREILEDEICINIMDGPINVHYEDPVISAEELLEIYHELKEYFSDSQNPKA